MQLNLNKTESIKKGSSRFLGIKKWIRCVEEHVQKQREETLLCIWHDSTAAPNSIMCKDTEVIENNREEKYPQNILRELSQH